MSGISERVLVMGKVRLSGKRERLVPFPWDFVDSGVAQGYEPAEWQPMGRVNDVNRLRHKASPDVLPEKTAVMDFAAPFFYDVIGDTKTLLHGGYVQMV